ncbi:hypothetical protein [Dyella japonica]|uniref:Uncharacterized protein n=1 Tax=Dyella japonica TaxID=231455 RepID=A0ABV2K3W2_9GAMM
MRISHGQAFPFGRYWIVVDAQTVSRPSMTGWIGRWEVYRGRPHSNKVPLRTGETDVEASKDLADILGRAFAIMITESMAPFHAKKKASNSFVEHTAIPK